MPKRQSHPVVFRRFKCSCASWPVLRHKTTTGLIANNYWTYRQQLLYLLATTPVLISGNCWHLDWPRLSSQTTSHVMMDNTARYDGQHGRL